MSETGHNILDDFSMFIKYFNLNGPYFYSFITHSKKCLNIDYYNILNFINININSLLNGQ